MSGLNDDDEADFRAFMTTRCTALLRTAVLLTGDAGDAEDLTQTAFAKVYASWPRVSRADSPDAYLRRVLVNAFISRVRRRRVAQLLTHRPPDRAIADMADRVVVRSVLVAALGRLPPGRRTAVVLRYWEDLSESAAAAAMGCSVGTVRSQAHKGLAQLRADPHTASLVHPEMSDIDGTVRS